MTVWIKGRGDDPLFMGRLVRFLMHTGIHISCLAPKGNTRASNKKVTSPMEPLTSNNLEETVRADGKRTLYLVYRRPKKLKDNQVKMPLSMSLQSWVADWLDQKRPMSRSRYNQLLGGLQDRLLDAGYRIHLNPHRFRHQAMRLLMQEFGLNSGDVERMTGTTRETVEKYGKRPIDEIAAELEQKGW